jgi:hypothetical protein
VQGVALTAAERQRRRRARIAAQRPTPIATPAEDRFTRQDAWDDACDTLQLMLEDYRTWRATTPTPADALAIHHLPRLAAQALTLAMVTFPAYFGDEWHFPDDAPLPKEGTALDARTLREQLFSAEPAADADPFPRTPEEDARGLAWWNRIPPDSRETWLRLARSAEPLDVWYLFHAQLAKLG